MGITTRLRLACGALFLIGSAAAAAQNAVLGESADLYAGPDNSYPVVAQLESDTPVQVYGCLEDWSWCDVSFEDARGWVFAPALNYQYQGDYVPVYSYAPALGIAVVSFSLGDYWGHYYHSRPWYGQRTEWEHREIHHRRPPGPPPNVRVMPAHPEHGRGPREGGRPDERAHSVHAASPPAHREDQREDHEHDRPGDRHGNAQPPQPARAPEPPRHEQAQHHDMPQHHEEPQRREPPRPEAHAAPGPAPGAAMRAAPHEGPHEAHVPSPPQAHAPAPPHEERREEKPH